MDKETAYIANELSKAIEYIKSLEAQNKKLKSALEFYKNKGDEDEYINYIGFCIELRRDGRGEDKDIGERARQALKDCEDLEGL
jgi:hypothetical protein